MQLLLDEGRLRERMQRFAQAIFRDGYQFVLNVAYTESRS